MDAYSPPEPPAFDHRPLVGRQPLFRRQALSQLATPEQFGQAIRVTSPRAWIALLALLLLLVAGIGWGVFGRIPTSVSARGILLRSGGQLEAVLYLPVEQIGAIQPGMIAQVRPSVPGPDQNRRVLGAVRAVSRTPATQRAMLQTLGSAALVRSFAESGLVSEVTIDLRSESRASNGYAWSSPDDAANALEPGAICEVTIITGERAPLPLGR